MAISAHQSQSVPIDGNQCQSVPVSGHQGQSLTISVNQGQSEAISGKQHPPHLLMLMCVRSELPMYRCPTPLTSVTLAFTR